MRNKYKILISNNIRRLTWVWRKRGIISRGQYLCIFAAVARVENVLEAATAAICRDG